MINDIKEIWAEVSAKLKDAIANDGVFDSYIAVNSPVSIDDTTLTLSVDDAFLRDWLIDNYKSMISDAVTIVTGSKHEIVWQVTQSEAANIPPQPIPQHIVEPPQPPKKVFISNTIPSGNCIGTLNPDFTFDEFVVGPSNSFTHSAARAVAEKPGMAYNPLFIYGDTGLGKTHLMQAVGHELLKRGKKVAYITTEQLLREYSNAIVHGKTLEFRDKYRKVDLFMVDDIQFFSGKTGTQEEFFHTFNALYQDHKQIIITSDRPATEVSGLEKRLVSRFNAGLSVEMESPNFEMRLAILRYKQSHMEVKLSEATEIFIAENVKSNVRTLEGAMNRALAYKSLNQMQPLTIDNLRYLLRDIISEEHETSITLGDIRKAVSKFYNIDEEELNKETRLQSIVIPRQIAMYLCRVLTESSLPGIAKVFARTHANVYHACTKVQQLYKSDETIHQNIISILEKLGKDPSVLE